MMSTPALPVDALIVSLGSTGGLRAADEELRSSLERAGASVALVTAHAPRALRTLALTDLAWAVAARRAATAELGRRPARAVIYSSITAALLWPRPGAIRFDAPAAGNRPGRHGFWQRPLERARFAAAPLLLPWSAGGLAEAPAAARDSARALVVPVPVELEPVRVDAGGDAAAVRDIAAITYAANPHKKGLDRVLDAWRRVRRDGEQLVVAGVDLQLHEDGVRVVGMLAPAEYRALLQRSRVFVCAARREDYGIAQLEALAAGCQLVTTPAPGPYAALALARELDARLVDDRLDGPLRAALDTPLDGYAERARAVLAPYGREAVDRVVAEELLPRLLG